DRAGRRRQGHLDKNDAALLDDELVDQPELDDVDRDFRVAHGLERLEHRFEERGIVFALRPFDVRGLRRRWLRAEIEVIALFVLARHPLPLFGLDGLAAETALQRRLESMP